MNEYNIEFAHIYANEQFGEEQEKSIIILKEIIKKLNAEKKSFVTTVLIDEFNAPVFQLNVTKFEEKLKSYNIPLDTIALESKFGEIVEKLIK